MSFRRIAPPTVATDDGSLVVIPGVTTDQGRGGSVLTWQGSAHDPTWSPPGTKSPLPSPPTAVAVGDPNAGLTAAQISTSPDGVNWTVRTNPIYQCYQVAWSPYLQLYLAVGNNSASPSAEVIVTSPDGITWTAQTLTDPVANGTRVTAVIWVAELGIFVIGTYAGSIATSPDGTTWTWHTPTPFGTANSTGAGYGQVLCFAWSPELHTLVAVGQSNGIMTSLDGITWKARTAWPGLGTASSDRLWRVTWSAPLGLFIAAYTGAATPQHQLGTSLDGITWKAQNVAAVNGEEIHGIAWSATLGLFVLVGVSTSLIMTSTNGITWKAQTTPAGLPGVGFTAVTWSTALGVFIAVGTNGNLITSPDGINWTKQVSGQSVYSLESVV